MVQYREDCRQLDADPRLAPAAGSGAAGAREQQEEMQGQARGLSQAISALGSAVKADVEQVRPCCARLRPVRQVAGLPGCCAEGRA